MTEHAFTAPAPKRKLLDRLFPGQWCELPKAPAEFQDVVHVSICTHFGWADRLRILLTGIVVTETKVVTEFTAGKTIGGSASFPSNRHRCKGAI